MLIPYQVDVPMSRYPIANFAIIGVTAFVSLLALFGGLPEWVIEAMIMDDWSVVGILGSELLHADLFHLFGNMLFLWVFGNSVCAKIGNWQYPLIYAGLALFAGGVHLTFDGSPTIGASDAINGVVAMYLVWYPLNDVSCFYWFFGQFGTFRISGYYMILLWLIFDIWGIVSGSAGVAYWAHIGGFVGGFGLAALQSGLGVVTSSSYERDLFECTGWKRVPEDEEEVVRGPKPVSSTVSQVISKAAVPKPQVLEPIELSGPDDGMIHFNCVGCGKSLEMPVTSAGRKGRCPQCRTILEVPRAG